MSLEATRTPVRGRQPRSGLMSLCPSVFRVSGQHVKQLTSHATASALMFLEATRTLVRGRQPRSGLICFLCSLCSYVPAVSASKPRSGLMSLCSYVLMFPALAAAKSHLGVCPSSYHYIPPPRGHTVPINVT